MWGEVEGRYKQPYWTTITATKEDYENVTESLLDMFAYLPIRYFDKYLFGSRNDVMMAFSLLPPIIRFKVLEYLYSLDPLNISVVDKLILAMMKANNPDAAKEWLEVHKAELESLKSVSESAYKDLVEKQGEEIAKLIVESGPKNMYELCLGKIGQLSKRIDGEGTLYKTFEEAYPYYIKNGFINENTSEINEFNDMMEFLYLGRKANDSIKELEDPYLVINII